MQGLMTLGDVAKVQNCHAGHLYRLTARREDSSDALYVVADSRDVVQRRLPKLHRQDGEAVIEHGGIKIRGPFTVTRVCPRRRSADGQPEDYTVELHGRHYCRNGHDCCLRSHK
jgi:hypothetical protein